MAASAARRLSVVLAAVLAAALSAGSASSARAGANAVLIVDGSNSMNSAADGGTRLDGVKAAVAEAAPGIEPAVDLGVVAFGTRQERSCLDLVRLVPPASGGAARAVGAVRAMSAQGVSAIAQSLQFAANEAGYEERAASIILIADGSGADSCGDPCAIAAQLERDAVDIEVHVIAAYAKGDELPGLQCIATATGGTFASASSRDGIRQALASAFARAAAQEPVEVAAVVPPPRPKPKRPQASVAAEAQPAETAPAGGEAERVAATPEAAAEERWPRPNPRRSRGAVGIATAAVDGSGRSNVSVLAPTGVERAASAAPGTTAGGRAGDDGSANESVMAPSATERVAAADDGTPRPDEAPRVTAGIGHLAASLSLPAPPLTTILVRRDPKEAPVAQDGAPGSAPTPTAVRAARLLPGASAREPAAPSPATGGATGRVKLAAYIIAGTKPIPSGMTWQVLESRGGGPGNLVARSSEPVPELALPAGEYVVRAVFGNATGSVPAAVRAGETTTVEVVLNAGGLQIIPLNAGVEDPEATVLNTIYAVTDPTRPLVRDAASNQVVYLNAGTYRVESRFGNANAVEVADIKVQAGKLVKAKINHRAGPAAFRLLPEGGDTPLTDTTWQFLSSDGRVIAQSRDATPSYVFAEGAYDVVVQHAGKTYRSSFRITPGGSPTSVEIVAR